MNERQKGLVDGFQQLTMGVLACGFLLVAGVWFFLNRADFLGFEYIALLGVYLCVLLLLEEDE